MFSARRQARCLAGGLDIFLAAREKRGGAFIAAGTTRAGGEGEMARLTEGTSVLSFDCGLTNLCYCLVEDLGPAPAGPADPADVLLDGHRHRLIKWQNFSLHADTLKEATEAFVAEANRRPWMLGVDHVVVEAQVLRNVQMKCLSHVIQAYFVTRATAPVEFEGGVMRQQPHSGPPVNFVEAKNKLTLTEVPEPAIKSRRVRNKRVAILMAQKILASTPAALDFLNSFDKKDDLADSFLQGLYFLRLLRTRAKNARTIRRHLGLAREGAVIDLNLNEGCELDDEVPLPKTYKRETYSHPVYKLDQLNASACYRRVLEPPRWPGGGDKAAEETSSP
jgi:hypothetical protein